MRVFLLVRRVCDCCVVAAVVVQVAEKDWFHSFVVGDMADFHAYIEEKRRDHVWGDDPEIQVHPTSTLSH